MKIQILYKKGIIVEGYEDLFSDKGSASDNVSQWDIKSMKSAETEFSDENVEHKSSKSGTDVSPLMNSVSKEDIQQRTETVAEMLRTVYNFKKDKILCVRNSINSFQIFETMISVPTINIIDTVHTICALRKSFKKNPYQDRKMPPPPKEDAPPPPPPPPLPESDSDKDIYGQMKRSNRNFIGTTICIEASSPYVRMDMTQ